MRYCLVEQEKYFDEVGIITVYGIRGVETEQDCIKEYTIDDVSDDKDMVLRMIDLMNREDVCLCHMESVILDCINLLVNDENYDIIMT